MGGEEEVKWEEVKMGLEELKVWRGLGVRKEGIGMIREEKEEEEDCRSVLERREERQRQREMGV